MRKRWCLFAVPLLICPSAHAEDLSAESLSSLSSVGSSTRDVVRDASSLSSIPELSSQSLDGAAGNTPGKLDAKKRVLGSNGKRIRYTSVNERGEKVPVTGALYDRPFAKGLVVLAPGTRGLGDQCAPSAGSSMLSSLGPNGTVNINYEAPMVQMLLDDGYRVVVTDYMGLGTDGLHTYLNRVDQGRAVIDAARAVTKRGEKVAFWGYSQGGGATASAAELAATYAPELDVVVTFAGAPPADLSQVLDRIDGNMIMGAIGYAVNGFLASEPQLRPLMDEIASPYGRRILSELEQDCIGDSVERVGLHRTNSWTVDGRSLSDHFAEHPEIVAALDHHRIGRLKPNAPVLVLNGRNDDVIPFGQAEQMARDWCAQGADVTFVAAEIPRIAPGLGIGHTAPMMSGSELATHYLATAFGIALKEASASGSGGDISLPGTCQF